MKYERGSLLIYGLVALFVAAAGTAVVWKYNSALEEAADAKHDAEEARQEAANWKADAEKAWGDLDAANRMAKAAKDESRFLREQLARFDQRLAGLEASNPAAAASLAHRIDPAVRQLRRLNAGCSPDLSVPCTPRIVGADPTAPAEGRNGEGATAGEPGSEARLGVGKRGQSPG